MLIHTLHRTLIVIWDSFEPSEGNFTFEWFDEVMEQFAEAGIKVVLDIVTPPVPTAGATLLG